MEDDQPPDSRNLIPWDLGYSKIQELRILPWIPSRLPWKAALHFPSHEHSAPQVHFQEDYRQQNKNPEAHYQPVNRKGNMRPGEHKWPTSINPANEAPCQHIFQTPETN